MKRVLLLIGALAALLLVGCGGGEDGGTTSASTPGAERAEATIARAIKVLPAECTTSGEERSFGRLSAPVANLVDDHPKMELPNGETVEEMANRLVDAIRRTGICLAEVETLELTLGS